MVEPTIVPYKQLMLMLGAKGFTKDLTTLCKEGLLVPAENHSGVMVTDLGKRHLFAGEQGIVVVPSPQPAVGTNWLEPQRGTDWLDVLAFRGKFNARVDELLDGFVELFLDSDYTHYAYSISRPSKILDFVAYYKQGSDPYSWPCMRVFVTKLGKNYPEVNIYSGQRFGQYPQLMDGEQYSFEDTHG